MIEVPAVLPGEWAMLRDLRLAALCDAPAAFESTYAGEAGFAEDVWRARLTARAYFAALDGISPVGLAAGYHDPDDPPGRRELHSMWVAPAARGRSVAGLLIEAVVAWARDGGGTELVLWVIVGNAAARSTYERAGFMLTGERQPVRGGDGRVEERMVLRLASG